MVRYLADLELWRAFFSGLLPIVGAGVVVLILPSISRRYSGVNKQRIEAAIAIVTLSVTAGMLLWTMLYQVQHLRRRFTLYTSALLAGTISGVLILHDLARRRKRLISAGSPSAIEKGA